MAQYCTAVGSRFLIHLPCHLQRLPKPPLRRPLLLPTQTHPSETVHLRLHHHFVFCTRPSSHPLFDLRNAHETVRVLGNARNIKDSVSALYHHGRGHCVKNNRKMDNMSFNPFDSEMESYFDFVDQGFLPSPMSRSPTFGYAHSDTIDPISTMSGTNGGERRQVYSSGPSHEYGNFRQLTGLPTGAMSNVSAYNDISDAGFDFNQPSNPIINYNTGIDFDMDYSSVSQSTLPPYLFADCPQPMSDFTNTTAAAAPPTLAVPRQQNRLWPGMHSQQAEQAKADALARQQHQQQIGQQIMQQRQQQISTPQPIISRSAPQPTSHAADPIVEERISRLLDQMRHNSTVPSVDDDADSPGGDDGSRAARMRKDEEDMDDDERLLASDQGKKLSSKERRQLRNKVSARAFRSRRKGMPICPYIIRTCIMLIICRIYWSTRRRGCSQDLRMQRTQGSQPQPARPEPTAHKTHTNATTASRLWHFPQRYEQ